MLGHECGESYLPRMRRWIICVALVGSLSDGSYWHDQINVFAESYRAIAYSRQFLIWAASYSLYRVLRQAPAPYGRRARSNR